VFNPEYVRDGQGFSRIHLHEGIRNRGGPVSPGYEERSGLAKGFYRQFARNASLHSGRATEKKRNREAGT